MGRTTAVKTQLLFAFFFLLFFPFLFSSAEQSSLNRRFSISIEKEQVLLTSPTNNNNTFSFGFYNVGNNAYCLSIWFNDNNHTVVWTANRDAPVNGRGSKLSLGRSGDLVLTDVDGSTVWETGTSTAVAVELLYTGNLVLRNSSGDTVWESFNFPTDTLLPSQALTKGTKLVSAMVKGSPDSGYYNLYFDNDNVLRLMYDGPEITSIYWPNPDYQVFQNGRTNYNSSRRAVLDDSGQFYSSDGLKANASDYGDKGVRRRITMDYDGNLRMYSLDSSTGKWSVTWSAMQQLCSVHGICGRNGICSYMPELTCSCPPGYEMTDISDWNKGCKPKFNQSNCDPKQEFKFVELHHTDFYGFDLGSYATGITFESCMGKCLNDCSCAAFGYRLLGNGACYPKSDLFNGYTSSAFPGNMFLKLPATMQLLSETSSQTDLRCNNANGTETVEGSPSMYVTNSGRFKWAYLFGFVAAFGGIEIVVLVTGWWYLFRDQHGLPQGLEEGYKLVSGQFRRFSYRELKEATGSFKEELGNGSSGTVYRGVLDDKRIVAVKKLRDVVQSEEEFWSEVSFIGRINHMNLVRMWGFCSERHHRLLVYEYVEKRSLDKFLFSRSNSNTSSLSWTNRYKIALGIARGLQYLHHECLEWVIHCDIKPQNILLTAEFDAKIADFGLAKLWRRDVSGLELSTMRGTTGYMAPEWGLGLPITAKVDVYSYGIVLLELVTGSRVSDGVPVAGDKMEFRKFVRMLKENFGSTDEEWLASVVDGRLSQQFDLRQERTLLEVAVSCVEEEGSRRPTMNTVVATLLASEESSAKNSLLQNN